MRFVQKTKTNYRKTTHEITQVFPVPPVETLDINLDKIDEILDENEN
jgi:hypothetical protein